MPLDGSEIQEEIVLGVADPIPGKKKKLNKKLLIGIIAALVAVVAVVVTLVIINNKDDATMTQKLEDKLEDIERDKFDSSEEYFAQVESAYLSTAVSHLFGKVKDSASQADLANGEINESTGGEMTLHVLLGEELRTMIGSASGMDDTDWLSDVMIGAEYDMKGEFIRMAMTAGLAKDEILTAEILMNISDYMMYISLPDLSKESLEIDLDEMTGGEISAMAESDEMELINEILAVLPEEDEMDEMLQRYLIVALSCVKNIEESSETIEVNGIEQECTVLTLTIDQATLFDMMLAIMTEAKDDDELIEMVEEIADILGEDLDMESFLEEGIDYYTELADSVETESGMEIISWTDYVDDSNHVIGRTVEIPLEDGISVSYLTATDGNDFAYTADIAGFVAINGTGTTDDGKINADYTVSVANIPVVGSLDVLNIEAVDVDEKEYENGYVYGTVILTVNEDVLSVLSQYSDQLGIPAYVLELLNNYDISIELETKEDYCGISLMLDGELFLGITAEYKSTNASGLKEPSKTVDIEDAQDWVESFDFDELIKNLEKAGVPDELVELVEEAIDSIT